MSPAGLNLNISVKLKTVFKTEQQINLHCINFLFHFSNTMVKNCIAGY